MVGNSAAFPSHTKFFDFDLIKENMNLELWVEAFNISNHPNFGLPGLLLFSGIDQAMGYVIQRLDNHQYRGQCAATAALKFRF